MLRQTLIATAAALLLAGATAAAAEKAGGALDQGQLAAQLHEDNQREIALGRLAEQNAGSPQVKQLAQTIAKDHQAADAQLQQLAQQQKWNLKQKYESKLPKQEQQSEQVVKAYQKQLETVKGAEFDRVYLSAMLFEHSQDVPRLSSLASSLQGQPLQAFIMQVLPTLQKHQTMSYDLFGSQVVAPARAQAGGQTGTGGTGDVQQSP